MSLKRWMQGLAVCLLAVVMLGAADGGARFNRLGHEMMCACGCGQILLECNHVGCPDLRPDDQRAARADGRRAARTIRL